MPSVTSVTFTGSQWVVGIPITSKVAFLHSPPRGDASGISVLDGAIRRRVSSMTQSHHGVGVYWAFFSGMNDGTNLKSQLTAVLEQLAPGYRVPIDMYREWFVTVRFAERVSSTEVPRVTARLNALEETGWRYEDGRRALIIRRRRKPLSELEAVLRSALTF